MLEKQEQHGKQDHARHAQGAKPDVHGHQGRQGREVSLEEQKKEESWQPSYEGIELREILDRLDEKEKTVVVLRYFHDLKLEDIGEILGENVNTVKARLYRTLKKMRLELEPENSAGRETAWKTGKKN